MFRDYEYSARPDFAPDRKIREEKAELRLKGKDETI